MISEISQIDSAAQDRQVHASLYKTKACRKFMANGVCPYESRCMFAHSEKELRTVEMNEKDGLITEEAVKKFIQSLKKSAPTQLLMSNPLSISPSVTVQAAQGRRFVHSPYSPSCSYAYVEDETTAASPPTKEYCRVKGAMESLVFEP